MTGEERLFPLISHETKMAHKGNNSVQTECLGALVQFGVGEFVDHGT